MSTDHPDQPAEPKADHVPDILRRLEAAAGDLRAKEEAVELARDLRDRIVEEAIDQGGLSQRKVAQAAGVKQSTVVRILAHG